MKARTFRQKALKFADQSATASVRAAEVLRELSSALVEAGTTSVAHAVAGARIEGTPPAHRRGPTIADARAALAEFRASLSAQDKRSSARDFKALENLISGHDSGSLSALVAAVRQTFASKAQPKRKRKHPMNQALVTKFVDRLEAALGDEDKFKSVFAELENNPDIGQPEAVAIARGFMGKTSSTASRRAALDRIYSRHAALMDFKAKRKAFGGRTAA